MGDGNEDRLARAVAARYSLQREIDRGGMAVVYLARDLDELSQRPLYEVLGTPSEHKRHRTFPASHFTPLNEVIKDTLDWFDKYLGVPSGQ